MSIFNTLFGNASAKAQAEKDKLYIEAKNEAAMIAKLARKAVSAVELKTSEDVAALQANLLGPGTITNVRKPARPGDTPPRQFVGKTLDTLKATLDTYSTERDALAKDIGKLSEELAQVTASIAALALAMTKLDSQPQSELDLDTGTQKALETALIPNAGTV